MILANVRQRLTRDDAQLALRLVSRGSETGFAAAEDALRRDGLDALPGFQPRPADVDAAGTHSSDLVVVAGTTELG